jgi:hypothetical protein
MIPSGVLLDLLATTLPTDPDSVREAIEALEEGARRADIARQQLIEQRRR